MTETFPAAAIVDDGTTDIDEFLAAAVRRRQALGLAVRGLVMRRTRGPHDPRVPSMVLVDVHAGREYVVSQPTGSQSNACRADTQGFARASQVLRDALADAPDLVVSNRYGDLEVNRGGFSAELLAVMERGIPLLTTVAAHNAGAWREFTGGAALLPVDAAAVDAWLDAVSPPRA